jgi:hypothetical protein
MNLRRVKNPPFDCRGLNLIHLSEFIHGWIVGLNVIYFHYEIKSLGPI